MGVLYSASINRQSDTNDKTNEYDPFQIIEFL